VRQKGSHVVLQHKTDGRTRTVPVPLDRELKSGTLLAILRQSGLARIVFE
jgi:predicted RNA binding protein YcfA (HicA-like mRNA interferase family)